MPERRARPRRVPDGDEPLARTRLRTGPELDVLDIADGGVRATTTSRLLPGTHVDVHVVTRTGRVLRRARVARAQVVAVDAQRLVYEVALSFDLPIDSAAARVVPTQRRPDWSANFGDPLPDNGATRPASPAVTGATRPADQDVPGTGIGTGPA